jgi:hypothetical protein
MFKFRLERFIDINLETNQAYLYLDDKPLIEVGYPDWFMWLERSTSFHFESSYIGKKPFTARKHKRDSGDFWYAYRKVGGKLRNAYLGKSDRLSVERMLEIAERLDNGYALRHQDKPRQLDNGYAQEYITQDQVADLEDKLENCQQDCKRFTVENQRLLADQSRADMAISELRSQLAFAQEERDKLQLQLDDQAAKAGEWYEKAKLATEEIERLQSQLVPVPIIDAADVVKDLGTMLSTTLEPATAELQTDQSLTGRALAERLGTNESTLRGRKLKPDFPNWSRERDPDGIAWGYDAESKLFYPIEKKS